MSLAQRVEEARSCASDSAAEGVAVDFALLRSAVSRLLDADELARMVSDNPMQARNEIREACRRVFARPDWNGRSTALNESLVQALLDTVAEFNQAIDEYIQWYNTERIQQRLKGLTPMQYRNQTLEALTA